ncbi:unnamed protein product [Hydatigera taeniaeformis]|uniref:Brix domain-containing protein n=1 Tax=Hydatigena taeniaeformis TaxID=6205 RepID=A0A0R3X0R9_HYDTA|nr:unnamed protein product [Hydatigera taeniaeformis]
MNRKETTRHHAREINNKERAKKAKEKRQRRREQKKSGKIAGIPHTLETLRNPDETILPRDDVDLLHEEENDELSRIYSGAVEPKLLLTHSDRVTPPTIGFCKELSRVIPNTTFVPRWHLPLKKLIPKAIEHGYTALLVVNDDMKKLNTLVVSHLPDGPTATFHVTNVTPRRKLRGLKNRGIEEGVIPHLILNRFMTTLGRRVERILGALFPSASRGSPPPHCRTVVFHNQRDFIFFRHYRYIHRKNGDATTDRKNYVIDNEGDEADAGSSVRPSDRVVVNEVGPRFTLKLKSIQVGTFDSQFGDYEWVKKGAVIGKSRRTFVL